MYTITLYRYGSNVAVTYPALSADLSFTNFTIIVRINVEACHCIRGAFTSGSLPTACLTCYEQCFMKQLECDNMSEAINT